MFEPPGRRGQTSTLSWSHIELIVTQADNVLFQSRMLDANALDPFHAAQHGLKKEVRHNGPHRPLPSQSPQISSSKSWPKSELRATFWCWLFSNKLRAWTVVTSGDNGTRVVAMPVYGNTRATWCVVPRRACDARHGTGFQREALGAWSLPLAVWRSTSTRQPHCSICLVGRQGYGCCRCPPWFRTHFATTGTFWREDSLASHFAIAFWCSTCFAPFEEARKKYASRLDRQNGE
jgi:hypothetical protein